jgi:hypothetical protein
MARWPGKSEQNSEPPRPTLHSSVSRAEAETVERHAGEIAAALGLGRCLQAAPQTAEARLQDFVSSAFSSMRKATSRSNTLSLWRWRKKKAAEPG